MGGSRPGGPVDPLQLVPVLVAPPVGAGAAQQPNRPDPPGARKVRAPTEVDELEVAVDGHLVASGHLVGIDALDDLPLEGMALEEVERLVAAQCLPDERLVGSDDLLHPGLDLLQVLGSEWAVDFEVVVEAVIDGRPDGEGGTVEQAEHRLGQDVGR